MYDVFIKKEIEMFEVFLFQLACCCEKLELIASNHRREIDSIDSVISELSSLTGLDQPISDLRRKKELLERQYQMLLSMAQGLGKIRLNYMKTEQRICDNGEGARNTFSRIDVLLQTGYFDYKPIEKIPFII